MAETPISSEEQKAFEAAEKIFDPYYAGPLLAPGASIPDPGHFAVQPFLFLTETYGVYDDRGRGQPIDHIHSVNPSVLAFAGFTKRIGLQFAGGYIHNRQNGRSGQDWTDPSFTLLLPFVDETPRIPGVMFAIRQAFPAGSYQRLNPQRKGMDAIGSGAYLTSLWLNFAKIVLAIPKHPMRFRLSNQYTFPARTSVHGFNSYGGGIGADARVKLRDSFRMDFGYEFSFTQKWVAAFDFVYIYAGEVTFTGFPGMNLDCQLSNIGGPQFQQMSLSPALEYNVNESFGFIGGVWFSFWGRNSPQFTSGVVSFYVRW